ncbi:MAG TPA: hypothetical protein VM843_02965 [Flavisolibacter sp.]|jgi:hypothetical protein|nr:hypothetical protein [Flavisolibacter sp.]
MKQNSTSSLGALHPILFFMMVYGISLFLALFVCRTVYYNINGEEASAGKVTNTQQNQSNAVALR